jgi:predicted component of type VI protein secretion system
MTKRLQVLFEAPELKEIQRMARANRMTVAEWVRQALRVACRRESSGDVEKKVAAIRAAARCGFPTADIDRMNEEIERGYLDAPRA